MNPAALILAFISCWSITVVGVYLAVAGLSNLQQNRVTSQGAGSRSRVVFLLLQRQFFHLWDSLTVLLGTVMAISGMVFLYLLVYG